MEQGSAEWFEARLGKATASRFADITSQPRSKKDKDAGVMSQTAKSYLMELAAETMTGSWKDVKTRPMDWGNENEPAARATYGFISGNAVVEPGLIIHPANPFVGASADGLIDDDGGLEIKCPYTTEKHLETVLSGAMPDEHIPQVQGAMWVTGRVWWDFVSFDPRIDGRSRFFMTRIKRDVEYIKMLELAVFNFTEKLHDILDKLR